MTAQEQAIIRRIQMHFETYGVPETHLQLAGIVQTMAQIQTGAPLSGEALNKLISSTKNLANAMGGLGAHVDDASGSLGGFQKNLRDASSFMDKVRNSASSLLSPLNSLGALVGGTGVGFTTALGIGDKYNKSLLETSASFNKYGVGAATLKNHIERLSDSTGLLRADTVALMQSYEKGFNFISLQSGENLILKLKNAVGANAQAMGQMENALTAIVSKFPDLEQGITNMNKGDQERLTIQNRLLLMTGQLSFSQAKSFQDYIQQNQQKNAADAKAKSDMESQIDAMNAIKKAIEDINIEIQKVMVQYLEPLAKWIKENKAEILKWVPTIAAVAGGFTLLSVAINAASGALNIYSLGMKVLKGMGGAGGASVGGAGNAISGAEAAAIPAANYAAARQLGLGGMGTGGGSLAYRAGQTATGLGMTGIAEGTGTMTGLGLSGAGLVGAGIVAAPVALTGLYINSKADEAIAAENDLHKTQNIDSNETSANIKRIGAALKNKYGNKEGTLLFDKWMQSPKNEFGVPKQNITDFTKPYETKTGTDVSTSVLSNITTNASNLPKQENADLRQMAAMRAGTFKYQTAAQDQEDRLNALGGTAIASTLGSTQEEKGVLQQVGLSDLMQTQNAGQESYTKMKSGKSTLEAATVDLQQKADTAKSDNEKAAILAKINTLKETESKLDGMINAADDKRNPILDEQSKMIGQQIALENERKTIIDAQEKVYQSQLGLLTSIVQQQSLTGEIDYGTTSKSIEETIKSINDMYRTRQEQIGEEKQLQEDQMALDNKKRDLNQGIINSLNDKTSKGGTLTIEEQNKLLNAQQGLLDANKSRAASSAMIQSGILDQQKMQNDVQKQYLEARESAMAPYEGTLSLEKAITTQAQLQVELADNLAIGFKASAQQRMLYAQTIDQYIDTMTQQLASLEDQRQKASGDEQLKLLNDELDINNKIKQSKLEQAQTLKVLRDGYVSAIQSMTIGTGAIGKFIIDQNKNVGIGIKYLGVLSALTVGGMGHGTDSRGARSASGFGMNGFYGPNNMNRPDYYNGGQGLAQEVQDKTAALANGVITNTNTTTAPMAAADKTMSAANKMDNAATVLQDSMKYLDDQIKRGMSGNGGLGAYGANDTNTGRIGAQTLNGVYPGATNAPPDGSTYTVPTNATVPVNVSPSAAGQLSGVYPGATNALPVAPQVTVPVAPAAPPPEFLSPAFIAAPNEVKLAGYEADADASRQNAIRTKYPDDRENYSAFAAQDDLQIARLKQLIAQTPQVTVPVAPGAPQTAVPAPSLPTDKQAGTAAAQTAAVNTVTKTPAIHETDAQIVAMHQKMAEYNKHIKGLKLTPEQLAKQHLTPDTDATALQYAQARAINMKNQANGLLGPATPLDLMVSNMNAAPKSQLNKNTAGANQANSTNTNAGKSNITIGNIRILFDDLNKMGTKIKDMVNDHLEKNTGLGLNTSTNSYSNYLT